MGAFSIEYQAFLDGYCSIVQGLLDWFEVDLGLFEVNVMFTELLFIHVSCLIEYQGLLGGVFEETYRKRLIKEPVCIHTH